MNFMQNRRLKVLLETSSLHRNLRKIEYRSVLSVTLCVIAVNDIVSAVSPTASASLYVDGLATH